MANREVDDHAISYLFAATGGNPLHALEAIRGALESGYGFDSGDHSVLPKSLREVVLKRVKRLGTEVQRMIEAASVAGNGFELGWLAAASALTDWQVLEVLG